MQRIAIVGSGIAGLGAAWLLQAHADVTVFEAARRAGGHAHTVMAGEQPVDTGFIVLNDRNYPFFNALLTELGVETLASDMSFGVSIGDGAIEWAGDDWRKLFAQKRRLVDRAHWRMLADILRFNRHAKRLLADDAVPAMALGAFLDRHRYSSVFAARYLLPMAAAIWSTPTAGMRDFPLVTFLRFFDQHGLLDLRDRPQWRAIRGGSRTYVRAIAQRLGSRLRLATPVARVARDAQGVALYTSAGETQRFDHVIFACHADDTHAMLAGADAQERDILSAFSFTDNRAVLHTDSRLMPRRRAVWSSWNYSAERPEVARQRVAVTYWMNRLQSIDSATPYLVSLNPLREPREDRVIREIGYRHPLFDERAIAAQGRLADIQGRGGIWHCGAWCGHGFHEDGLASAVRVAEALGAPVRWHG